MYESYAAIYDLAQQGRYGEQMARWSLDWVVERGEQPKQVLELACGTGSAALVFAKTGCKVVGIDRSHDMLAIAQAKARDVGATITFAHADMRNLADNNGQRTTNNKPFDLVTCFADSLNYLTEDGDLERVFGSAAAALHRNGYLIFDINTEAEYATWHERDVVVCDNNQLLFYQKLNFNERTRLGTGKIGWMVREIDRWWRGEETHIQRAWSDNQVRAALNHAGFELVLAEPAPEALDDRRFVYCGRKI